LARQLTILRGGKSATDDFYLIFVVDPARKPLGEVPLSKLLCAQRPRPYFRNHGI
jgi:Mg/Co/Ni transporter MgtE